MPSRTREFSKINVAQNESSNGKYLLFVLYAPNMSWWKMTIPTPLFDTMQDAIIEELKEKGVIYQIANVEEDRLSWKEGGY